MGIIQTATFLFTDLVDSTAISTSLSPREAEELRQAHFSLLRGPVAAAAGVEVKNLGDGLMIVFTSASRAIDCAVAMQQEADRRNRRDPVALQIRIGVAIGEAVEEDGDYFGDPVVEAARLCAAADGGQILTTTLVRAILGRRAEVELIRLGERVLKGLPDPVEVWEVGWAPPSDVATLPLSPKLAAVQLLPFVGRAAAVEALRVAWKTVVAGERRAVFVSGEPGIGKSRLVREVAAAAHADGAIVLFGSCDDELDMPYRPWVEALDHLVATAPAEVVEAVGTRRLVELARVVPAVADRLAGLDAASPSTSTRPDVETERYLFFSAVVALLASAARLAPVLVVLDDLQWADRSSLALLRHVVAASDAPSLLVVGTHREAEVTPEHPLAAALATMRRDGGAERLLLRGLEEDDLFELLEAIAGPAPGGVALARALRRETDGNPFFAGEVLRHLADTGAALDSPGDGPVELGLPESVREVVGQRVARLGEEVHASLTLASVIGTDFDLDVLTASSGENEDLMLDHLEVAESAGLVRAGAPGSFRFAHAIVRHTLYDQLSTTRRTRLHRRVALALEHLDVGRRRPGELAQHWTAAASAADLPKAVEYTRQAGENARASLAPDQAAEHFRRAAELLREHGADEPLECELWCSVAEAMRDAGDPEFRSVAVTAAEQADRLGLTDLLVRAALIEYKLQASAYVEERARVLSRALDAVGPGDSPGRVQLLAAMSAELNFVDGVAARRNTEEAVAMARRLGDARLLFNALTHPLFMHGEHRLEESREALAIARDLDDHVAVAIAAQRLFEDALNIGDLALALESKDLMVAATEQTIKPDRHWILQYTLADWATMTGDLDEAERLIEQTWDLGRRTGQPGALVIYAAHLGMLHWHRGEPERAAAIIADAAASDQNLSALWVTVGTSDDVRTQFAELPMDGSWLISMGLLAERIAASGDLELVMSAYEQLLPYAGLMNRAGPMCRGPVAHQLARLAAASGRLDDALRHFTDADALNRRLGFPFYTARTQTEWARLLLTEGQTDHARKLLTEARSAATAYGYAAVEARAARLLRAADQGAPRSSDRSG